MFSSTHRVDSITINNMAVNSIIHFVPQCRSHIQQATLLAGDMVSMIIVTLTLQSDTHMTRFGQETISVTAKCYIMSETIPLHTTTIGINLLFSNFYHKMALHEGPGSFWCCITMRTTFVPTQLQVCDYS